jgi:hypothetical protein
MKGNAKEKIVYFALGWLAILGLKYIVFGLTAWNNLLHPGLIPAPNQQAFLLPFLGIGQNNG